MAEEEPARAPSASKTARGAFAGLRAKLLLLVLVAALPALGVIAYSALWQRQAAVQDALDRAVRLADHAGAAHERLISAAGQLLVQLAHLPQTHGPDAAECQRLLAGLLEPLHGYANLGVLRADGTLFCSAVPPKSAITAAEQPWFRDAVARRALTVSGYHFGRITGRPVLVLAYPRHDRAGRLRAVYFASLDLAWFGRLAAAEHLADGNTITLFDRAGTILAHYPGGEPWIGRAARDCPAVRSALARGGEGTAEGMCLDRVERLFGYTVLGGLPAGNEVHVAVGLPRAAVAAEAQRLTLANLALFLPLTALILALASFGGEVLLVRPVRALARATRRLGGGDLSTRSGLAASGGEIGRLARAFDDMAAALRGREQALRESEGRYRRLAENARDLIFRYRLRPSAGFDYVNPAATVITGYTPEEHYADPAIALKLIHPDDRARLETMLRDPARLPDAVMLRWRHKNGATVWTELRVVPVHDGGGALIAVEGVARDISEAVHAERAMQQAQELLDKVFGSAHFMIALLDPEFNFIRVNRAYAEAERKEPDYFIGRNHFALYPSPEIEAVFRRVVTGGEPYVAHATPFRDGQPLRHGPSAWDWSLQPILDRHGRVERLVLGLVSATKRIKAEERALFLMQHDELTRLPRRALLLDRLRLALAEAGRRGRQVAVVDLELTHFRQSHSPGVLAIGDAVLRVAAERLSAGLRAGDTVARLGGDQFTILLNGIAELDDVRRVVRKIRDCLARPFTVGGKRLFVTTSLGIALHPLDGETPEALLRAAAHALRQACQGGGNSHRFHSPKLAALAAERQAFENGLRRAIEHRELLLHYQPQIALDSGAIVAVEALARWQHPRQGLIAPARFIPIAEASGLIVPIGEWLLEQTCAQARAWRLAGAPALRMAINLSLGQLRQAELAHAVAAALERYGLEPGSLEIEITEEALMVEDERVLGPLRDLSALGVRLALDDFGTGYSSLAYLKRLPVHCLKLDRSVVRDLGGGGGDFAGAVIAAAHGLGLCVIAEGVETEAQVAVLRRHGCDLAQGYRFAEPRPANELDDWLQPHRHFPGRRDEEPGGPAASVL